jgi:ABC-2 type transport system permease protein
MTATDSAPTSVAVPAAREPAVTWRRVHAAEWLRLTGLRSTGWLVASLAVAVLGLGVFPAIGVAVGALPPGPDVDPVGGVLSGIGVAELLVVGLGVLAVTGEYASGVIRSAFTAVPRRAPVVTARAAVVAELVLGVSLVAVAAAYGTARLLLGSAGVQLSLASDGAARALAGTVLYLALLAVVGTGLGWLVRSTAGALTAFFVVGYGLPGVVALLPHDVGAAVGPYLPVAAGRAVMQLDAGAPGLAPPAGLAVLAAYTAATVAAATLAARRRDV